MIMEMKKNKDPTTSPAIANRFAIRMKARATPSSPVVALLRACIIKCLCT